MRQRKHPSLLCFWDAFRQMLACQVISKAILAAGLWIARQLGGALLWIVGRSNYTHGELPYMLRAWQGWVLFVAGTLGLVLYTVFDMAVVLKFCRRAARGEPIAFRTLLSEARSSLRTLLSPLGVVIALYVTFVFPLAGAAVGVSFTNSFSIPDFIVSWIVRQRLQSILYFVSLAVLAALGVIYLFTMHFAILEGQRPRQALRSARLLMARRWKALAKGYLPFLLATLLGLAAMIGLLMVLPLTLVANLHLSRARFWYAFFVLLGGATCLAAALLFVPMQFFRLTLLFEAEMHPGWRAATPKRPRLIWRLPLAGAILAVVLALVLSGNFDFFFPRNLTTQIIAHRGGGMLSTENTVESLEAAIERGVYASEIDIQRTLDGHYILNHDKTFARVAGVDRRPQDMTLEEVKQLRIGGTAEVATIEEILDAAKGRIKLYIELKAPSADAQMIDDLYDMVTARDMLKEVAFISLNYSTIVVTEKLHPDVETVFLCYYAFGDFEDLVCDGLGLEAACATDANIARIHDAGLRVDVWTCNTTSSILQYLLSDADGVITDEVALAEALSAIFPQRRDLTRILNAFLPEF